MSSSSSSSSPSTPLYRVFRGLKSTQIVSIPSTNAEWRTAINDLKTIYLEGRWKQCENKCLRLIETCKRQNMPVIHGYLLFLIGSCVEIHARNMHQYSASKPKKMEDAATWLEKCERVLSNATSVLDEREVARDTVRTPQASRQKDRSYIEVDVSPLVLKKERIEKLADSVSKIIDVDLSNPYHDETDPFLSISAGTTPQRDSTARIRNWSALVPRLTPSPLRIHKDNQISPTPRFEVIPSPLSRVSRTPSRMNLREEEYLSTPVQRTKFECQPLVTRNAESEVEHTCEAGSQKDTSTDQDAQSMVHSRDSSLMDCQDTVTDDPVEARIQAKKESWRTEIDRRVADRMQKAEGNANRGKCRYSVNPAFENSQLGNILSSPVGTQESPDIRSRDISLSLSDIIHEYLGSKRNANMPLLLSPMPQSSSARPLPLSLKPKHIDQKDLEDSNPNSDRSSLACLQYVWEVSSFNGVFLVGSDRQSLHVVEETWKQLSEEYHLAKTIAQQNHQALQARVTKFNYQLSSLLHSLQHNIFCIRQLSIEIQCNRKTHIETRKLQPSKSYWSFSGSPFSKNNDTIDENSSESSDEHEREPRHRRKSDKPDMRLNIGWAALGTVLNESKKARIRRLKQGKFQNVGLRNEKRGHKGDEWYTYMCEEALGDIGGFFL